MKHTSTLNRKTDALHCDFCEKKTEQAPFAPHFISVCIITITLNHLPRKIKGPKRP